MNLYNELVVSNKKSAAVDIIISGDNYLMIPRGRSNDGSWFGLKYLDFIITGAKEELKDANFIDKLFLSIDVSINYDNKNINKNEKIEEIVSNFILKNKDVNRISINLDIRKPDAIIIHKFKKNNYGDFSAELNDSIILKNTINEKELLSAINMQLGLTNVNKR